MAKIQSVTFSVLFVLSLNHLGINGNECEDAMGSIQAKILKIIVPCIEELGLKTPEEKKANVFCIMKCVMVKSKWLDPDGTANIENLDKIMAEQVPPALKDKAADVLAKCGLHAGALDPNEAGCSSYEGLITCLVDVGLEICS